jgi:hypothetical protein
MREREGERAIARIAGGRRYWRGTRKETEQKKNKSATKPQQGNRRKGAQRQAERDDAGTTEDTGTKKRIPDKVSRTRKEKQD